MNVYIPSSGFATQGPCDSGFHVPLQTEWEGLKTILDGLTFSETYGNILSVNLKMPYAGYRNPSSSNVTDSGTRMSYWSSENSSGSGRFLYATSSELRMYYDNFSVTASGMSIRPFKDGFVVPTSSWTVINGTLGGAGIFWNSTDGIISITSNGITGYTIADKNLGATTVYSYGDTLSESNCGKFYQQGNNYGFAFTGSLTTSSTKVNAESYGPGNYYNSSTFITVSGNWDNSNNTNLRGGTDGNVPVTTMKEVNNIYIGEYIPNLATQGPCPDGFHIPLKSDFDDLVSCMTTFGLNKPGYYQSMLKMPNNGFRDYSNGNIANTYQGRCWTSSANTGTEYAYQFVFDLNYPSSTAFINASITKEYGCNIRPFKDTPVAPDSSWTELYSNSIYHNSTLGLISIKNGSSRITISDKNLGATVVFNSGDTVTADNGGTWYQRGNNYGFPRSGSVTTSSTQVNTTGYGPGNYYSRNVFVVSSSLRDWSSVTNDNLRGGVDGNVPVS